MGMLHPWYSPKVVKVKTVLQLNRELAKLVKLMKYVKIVNRSLLGYLY